MEKDDLAKKEGMGEGGNQRAQGSLGPEIIEKNEKLKGEISDLLKTATQEDTNEESRMKVVLKKVLPTISGRNMLVTMRWDTPEKVQPLVESRMKVVLKKVLPQRLMVEID